jgi:hypothetical protein
MKKFSFILCFLFCATLFCPTPLVGQNDFDISFDVDVIAPDQRAKIDTAFAVWAMVQEAGHYIKSLTDLLENGIVPLPVGIKSKEITVPAHPT